MYCPNYNLIIFLIVCFKCQAQYCGTSKDPPCLNNNRALCFESDVRKLEPNYLDHWPQNSIVRQFQGFRSSLRKKQTICNLEEFDFKWNYDLERFAEHILSNRSNANCLITKDYKNIIVHEQNFFKTDKSTDFWIRKKLNGSNSWFYSAYSNQIGCTFKCNETNYCDLLCLINGIELENVDQSLGYERQCSQSRFIYNNIPCNTGLHNCNSSHHFICNITDKFTGPKIAKMTFTDTKFILTKLEGENKYVFWDNDLQHLANQIIIQKLTKNEKCLTQALYQKKIINSFLLSGVKYFTEIISNIDYVWDTSNKHIGDKIGCAIFDTEDKFNIYCLSLRSFSDSIYLTETDCWILFGCILNVYGTIFAIILFIYCKKSYETKQIKFICEQELEEGIYQEIV